MIIKTVNDFPKPCILHADDDPEYAALMRCALEEAKIPHRLVWVPNGQEVCDYLSGADFYADRKKSPFPQLLLLDLHMPRLNGLDVLAWKQNHADSYNLPVVMLSNSDREIDIQQAKSLGVSDYRVKPFGLYALVALLRELNKTWLTPPPAPIMEIEIPQPLILA